MELLTYEENLLGTAGTLMENISLFDDKNCTGLIIHADNVTNTDISKLINFHYSKPENVILTMLTFNTNKPKQCGIVETDDKGIMTRFYEKWIILLVIKPMEQFMFSTKILLLLSKV